MRPMAPEYREAILKDAPKGTLEDLYDLEKLAVERFVAMAREDEEDEWEDAKAEAGLESVDVTPSRRRGIEIRMRELSQRLFRSEQ